MPKLVNNFHYWMNYHLFRRFPVACLALLVLLTALTTACESKPPPATLPYLFDEDVVLAFGDSITHGTGARSQESYPAVLSSLINRKVVNAGIPGDVTAGGLKRLPAALEKYKPALVLLCLGGNDFLRKKSAADTEANLNTMLDLIRNKGIPVVLIGVPRPGLSLKADPVYARLAEKHNVLLVEELLGEVLGKRSLKSDPIHPNARGYRFIAEELAEILDKNGAV